MINRIRDVRRQKQLTLAEVAERCRPITTAQTIGRLETGTRSLSLSWMNRIAAALDVEPGLLVRGETADQPQMIARLIDGGVEALAGPRDAILPTALGFDSPLVAVTVETGTGEYRAGDQIWLRQLREGYSRLVNRDVLVPRSGGRFAFGRLVDRDHSKVAILPLGSGQRQVIIDNPPWLAVAEMLVRKL